MGMPPEPGARRETPEADPQPWDVVEGGGSVVATAIHHGHDLRDEVAALLAIGETDRLREEDPFTADLTTVAATRIAVRRSRFEVDLNRPREKAVYLTPEDAWGLRVWKATPPREVVDRSLAIYDAFYAQVRQILAESERRARRFVVFDLHTYNHLRTGSHGPAADPAMHPEVNVGTGTMSRARWAPLVDRFIGDLRAFDFRGRRLDVRENVRFRGGQFPRWIHETFPHSGCALAIEFKKFFMNEWSGEVDRDALDTIRRALQSTMPGLLEELGRMAPEP